MEEVQIVDLLVNEGSRLAFAVALFVFYLKVTSKEHEKATALARLTADSAIEDLKEFRTLAREEIKTLKEDYTALKKELDECKHESAINLESYREKLMEVEDEAHAEKLRAASLEARIASLESQLTRRENG